jgi:hypothetical protein
MRRVDGCLDCDDCGYPWWPSNCDSMGVYAAGAFARVLNLIARYARNQCLKVKGPDKQIQSVRAKTKLIAVYLSVISYKNFGLRKFFFDCYWNIIKKKGTFAPQRNRRPDTLEHILEFFLTALRLGPYDPTRAAEPPCAMLPG